MRKIVLRFTFLLIGILTLGAVVQALPLDAPDRQGEGSDLASYFAEDTLVFAEARIDDVHLDQLDTIYRNVITTAPDFQGPSSLRDIFEEMITPEQTVGDVYAAFGGYVAVGVQLEVETFVPTYKIVADITDREFIEEVVEEGMSSEAEEVDGNTVYQDFGTAFIVTDDKLVVNISGDSDTENDVTVMPEDASLLDNESWQSAWDALPEDAYNISLFVDLPRLTQDPSIRMFNEEPLFNDLLESVGAVMVGMTILDDYSLVIDTIQLAGEQPQMFQLAEVDPDFVRYIPANMSAFAQYSDLTGIVNQSLEFADQLYAFYQEQQAVRFNGPSGTTTTEASDATFSELLRAGLRITGFDLDEDILSWTTGDFALFGRVDLMSLVELGSQSYSSEFPPEQMQEVINDFDFGGVFEIGDVESAQAFNEELSERILALDTLINASEVSDNIDVQQITIADAPVTTITVTESNFYREPPNQLSIDLAFGANDEVFVFGTLPVVEAVLNGEAGLDTSDVYQTGSEYILPNANTVFYGDSDLLTSFLGVYGFALAGPSIGYLYSDIQPVEPVFVPTMVPTPTPFIAPESTIEMATPTPLGTEVPTEEATDEAFNGGSFMNVSNDRQMDDPIEYFTSLIEHLHAVLDVGVISQAMTDDGGILTRTVLKLNPQ